MRRAIYCSGFSYVGFVQRLNKVADVFAPLLTIIQQESGCQSAKTAWLIDSFLVALAKQGHRFNAKVAPELTDHGYCSTKKPYYYGVWGHVAGRTQAGTLPSSGSMGLTGASNHDGKVFNQIRFASAYNVLYVDNAYRGFVWLD